MDKPITFNEWLGTQGNMVLLHANCCRIAFEGGQQSMQSKVEELKASHHGEVIGHEVHFKKIKQERDELQKRVQFLEQELGTWKGKSIAAMINGMCKQCGKEPWQAIVSDKEDYALLHCFGCGANKYELVGEQALKGEG
ncbi:TPA: hypothetical protein NU789_003860 [Acinetobacter baumannii]|uniref:hypothetical protein n=1 Tax=Acinetobacter baumannii TaxID=470 RepID=UPI000B545DDD|nr:hypothetical protein [Acinetobacter baumannii]MBV6560634.1 hypothetical protein [Acinetobacter baumannii]MBV6589283.1 hypothetical protein [Acinetobacter baumannii]MDA4864830.1 hypothetical protein [Acinetobacter baumannii]MDT1778899.1 hypothetical protein [Acinetobacter baumannii]OWX15379.1 hypothetical protein A7A33_00880 [Acinetobacter baumannii]